MVGVLLTGVIYGFTLVCTLTLLKSIIFWIDSKITIPPKIQKILYGFAGLCSSCLTFWLLLIFFLSLPIASIGWVAAKVVEKINNN